MITIWQAIGGAFQSVVIAVLTVAILALLRLITPIVRWGRRLKRDSEIYTALPEGREKEMWASSVTAQGERLRLYRENTSIAGQIIAWYALIALICSVFALVIQAARGWPAVPLLQPSADPLSLFLSCLLLAMNMAFAIWITVRLVRGLSTSLHAPSGHYPKYAALQREARKRSEKRFKIEGRAARLRVVEKRNLKEARRARR